MLSKLLKYEVKATGRLFLPLFLSLLVFALITKFTAAFNSQWHAPAIISMGIYNLIMAGMFVMTLIVMIQRFYKNLLCDEGYLMFTLPIKPWQHIVSKLLVSMLWIVSSVVVAIFSVVIIAYKKGMIAGIVKGFSILMSQLKGQWSASVSLITFEIFIGILLSLITGILLIYAAIAIGHLFSKHKMLASFGAFIVFNIIQQIFFMLSVNLLSGVAQYMNIQLTLNNNQEIIKLIFALGIIFIGLFGTAYFALTNFILSKRLNLE